MVNLLINQCTDHFTLAAYQLLAIVCYNRNNCKTHIEKGDTMRILYAILCACLITACSNTNTLKTAQQEPSSKLVFDLDTAKISEVTEGDFIFRIVSEKKEYLLNEPIQIYAELIYNGSEREVTITHEDSPIRLGLSELTRDYYFGYVIDQPLITTKLKRGEAYYKEYKFSGGGHDDTTPKEYVDFVNQLANGKYATGHYLINGNVKFNVTSPSMENDVKIKGSLDFEVVDSKLDVE